MSNDVSEVHSVLAAINSAWREGHPSSMQPYLHPDIAIVPPGLKQSIRGRDVLLHSFEEFCANAKVLEYAEDSEQISVIGNVAVATFHFDMLYSRAAYRERSQGHDLWVFEREEDRWIAVWRALVEASAERMTSN